MKALFDYFPLLVFFGIYFAAGRNIMLATWGIIIASLLQVTLGRLIRGRFDSLHLLIFFVTMVFGGLALIFHNETFIKWRPTITSFLLAGILMGGHFLERNLMQRLVETFSTRSLGFMLRLQRRDWLWLNLAFIVYFIAVGLLNLYVAFHFSTTVWVNFSLFGLGIIQTLFLILVFLFIYRRLPEEDRRRLTQSDEGK